MLYASNSSLHAPLNGRNSNLFRYVARCGDVTIHRDTLPQLARDLRVRVQDLASLIDRMRMLGQARSAGTTIHLGVRL